jgi:CRISPR/Cas system endoribonuclease Cas6 (RAMP superfamily)
MLIDRLQRSIEAESGYVIKFGATPAQLDNPATRIVRHLPYSKIVEITQGRHISEWDVDVQSPLLIRQGDRELIFPLPGSVLRSLHRQWVCWSDVVEGFPREISELPMLRTIGFDGSSSTVEVRGRPRTGFLGAVRYGLDSSVCRQAQAQVDALMEFAQFSGVGAMTTYGLGVVAVTPRL